MRAPPTSPKRIIGSETSLRSFNSSSAGCRQPGFLSADDPRWACPNLIEVVSAGADDDYLAVGSTPWLGDFAGTALTVPAAPTLTPRDRYLFLLAAIEIPGGASVVIRGLRQSVQILAPVPMEAGGNYPIYREQVSPFWHFSDGNVSWHLRHYTDLFRNVFDPAQAPGTSPTMRGTGPARLYQLGGPFAASGGGVPPGVDVQGLGTMRDLRYPWRNTNWGLAVPVGGPATIALFCSVKQTNPSTRPQLPNIAPNTSLAPEDVFTLETRQQTTEITRYGRVAGALLVEMFPCCKAPGESGT